MEKTKNFVKQIKNNLIVSCQAVGSEPLNNSIAISLMATSVLQGGAKFLRLSQKNHISKIKQITNVPIIGLIKQDYANSDVIITPSLKEAKTLAQLNVDCIAIDATLRKRPKQSLSQIVNWLKINYPQIALLADCATINDVINANQLGFDLVASTLHGYTQETKGMNNIDNDYAFIKQVLEVSSVPVIAEGGINFPSQVNDLLKLGVHAVVVGSAITRPKSITEYFLKSIKK